MPRRLTKLRSGLALEAVDEAPKGGGGCDGLEGAWQEGTQQLRQGGWVSSRGGSGRGNGNGIQDDCAVGTDVAPGLVAEGVKVASVVATCSQTRAFKARHVGQSLRQADSNLQKVA